MKHTKYVLRVYTKLKSNRVYKLTRYLKFCHDSWLHWGSQILQNVSGYTLRRRTGEIDRKCNVVDVCVQCVYILTAANCVLNFTRCSARKRSQTRCDEPQHTAGQLVPLLALHIRHPILPSMLHIKRPHNTFPMQLMHLWHVRKTANVECFDVFGGNFVFFYVKQTKSNQMINTNALD